MAPQTPLARSLFKRIFIYYLSLVLVVSAVPLGLEYSAARTQLADQLAALAQSSAPSAIDALRNYNHSLLDSITQSLVQHKSVAGATIATPSGEIIASAGSLSTTETAATHSFLSAYQSYQIPLLLAAGNQGQTDRPLGQLTLYPNREAVTARVQQVLLIILITSLAQLVGLWLIFRWVMVWRLSQPLTTLAEAITKFDVKDYAAQPLLPHYPYSDEIGQLVAAINQLWLRLSSSNQQLEQKVVEHTNGLQTANAFNETIVLNSPVAMAVYQGAGPCVQVNDAYAQLTGLTRQALLGQALRSNPIGQDAGLVENCINALVNQQQYRREICIRTSLGKERWLDCLILPTLVNKQPHLLLQFFDLTEVRAAAEALRQAKVLAETASQAKSDFLADMSHEIRTPLNSIIGLAYLALKTELTAKQRDHIQKIHEASHQLLVLISNVLDFAKIETGKLAIDQREFDLHQLFDIVANELGENTSQKGLELVLDIASDVPQRLIGDAVRLRQILLTLANTAIHRTQQGEIDILVRSGKRTQNKILIRFTIRDTRDLSIPQNHLLLEDLRQANTTVPDKYDGMRLGLAIAKRLVELMGGEISIDSDSDSSGATVWFATRFGIRADTQSTPHPHAMMLQDRRVLVVDDNEHAREAVHEMLRAMTFTVAAVASGTEALTEIVRSANSATPYEVVFLDWQMPEMDGITTACEIRGLALRSPPRIILFTAHGRDGLLKIARKAGIEEVLPKPITPSSLFEAVTRVLATDQTVYTAPIVAPLETDLTAIAGARILLVEDNDLNQAVAAEMLVNVGFKIDIANNGAIALTKFEHNDYDLILMDMQMPIMDGLTATREIRQQARGLTIPIIAMTANVLSGDRERCLASGMNDHVAKPIDPSELWTKLRRWIEPRHAPEPQPTLIKAAVTPVPLASGIDSLPTAAVNLDQAAGLNQALGQEKLYVTLLQKFTASALDFPAQLETALAAEDWELAERLAHTLKGNSAQIGAYPLRHQAEQLEQALRQRQPPTVLATQQTIIINQLAELQVAIKTALAHYAAPPAAPQTEPIIDTTDHTPLGQIYAELARLLAEDDCRSAQLLQQHETVLRTKLSAEFAAIAQAINDFDFPAALEKLQQAATRQGFTL